MKIKTQANQIKKDDSHLWQLVEELKKERKAAGITEQVFNLDRANALWEEYKETLSASTGIGWDLGSSRHYLIVIEPIHPDGFIAYCPAIENCAATAQTKEQAKEALINKVTRRLKEIAKKGQPLPTEQGSVEIVEIAVKP